MQICLLPLSNFSASCFRGPQEQLHRPVQRGGVEEDLSIRRERQRIFQQEAMDFKTSYNKRTTAEGSRVRQDKSCHEVAMDQTAESWKPG